MAIELPAELRKRLGEIQGKLARREFAGISWVKPENIHLTLKFLGEVEEAKIEEVKKSLEEASREVRPFVLSAGSLGGFPTLRAPRVLWVGIAESPPLMKLQGLIEEGLERIGFDREEKPFHAHLTLCRVKVASQGRMLGEAAEKLGEKAGVDFRVESVILYRSKLSPKGSEYSVLKELRFPE